jgi:hypothetical protein
MRRHGALSGVSGITCEFSTLLQALLLGGPLLETVSINFPSLRSFMNADDRVHHFVPAREIVNKKNI